LAELEEVFVREDGDVFGCEGAKLYFRSGISLCEYLFFDFLNKYIYALIAYLVICVKIGDGIHPCR
jgi:hypothetical protein